MSFWGENAGFLGLGSSASALVWCPAEAADPHHSATAEVKLLLLWMTCEIRANRRPLLGLGREEKVVIGTVGCKPAGCWRGSNPTV